MVPSRLPRRAGVHSAQIPAVVFRGFAHVETRHWSRVGSAIAREETTGHNPCF